MAKVPVTVSIGIEALAVVTVMVEERVPGQYGSVETRAKDHVLAAIGIGADLPWKVEYDLRHLSTANQYKFEATADSAEREVLLVPPAPGRPQVEASEG